MLLTPVADNYAGQHPNAEDVFLLIEVSDTMIEYDRQEKLLAYARAGVAEAWLVNLGEEAIEVYRQPSFSGYGSSVVLRGSEEARPEAFPDAGVRVGVLLRRSTAEREEPEV